MTLYAGDVKQTLSDVALVQHAPWDTSDGGAGSTSFMVNCLDVFMRHADGSAAKWDLIFFNTGLHNLNNSTEGLAAYKSQLGQVSETPTSRPRSWASFSRAQPRSHGSAWVDLDL